MQQHSEIILEFDFGDTSSQTSVTRTFAQHKKDVFLIGCFRSDEKAQINWILGEKPSRKDKLYNVRISKSRNGWVNNDNPKIQNPNYLILYEYGQDNTISYIFRVQSSDIKTESEMKELGYENPKGSYLIYALNEMVTFEPIKLNSIIQWYKTNRNWIEGKPIYLTGKEIIDILKPNQVKKHKNKKSQEYQNSLFSATINTNMLPSLESILEQLSFQKTFSPNSYTSIDLFSGCGGLTKGFSLAGIKSIFASDIDENCEKTFTRNFPGTPFICKDITNITKDEVDDKIKGINPDIIIGGPPCQGFSLANKRRGTIKDDPRNKLFYGFVKFVNWYSPKAFVMENVKGLLSMQHGEVMKTILEEFSNAGEYGYNVQYKVLKASDYGVPQNRERVIIIGFRKDLNIEPKHPNPYNIDHAITVDEAISDLPQIESGQGEEVMAYFTEPKNDYQKLMRANSKYVLNHIAMKHTPRLIERFKAIKQGQCLLDVWETHGAVKRGSPDEKSTIKFGQNNQRLFGDQPAPTIAASFQSNFIHPHLNRNFTAREGARLQSFPDDFVFEGMRTKMSWEKGLSQYQQIGNAVPVLLAKAIAESVIEQLKTIQNGRY